MLHFNRDLISNNLYLYLAVAVKGEVHDEVDDEVDDGQYYIEDIFSGEKTWLSVDDVVVKTIVEPDCDRFRALARGKDLLKVILWAQWPQP